MLYFFDILSLKLLDKIIFLDCVKDKKIKFIIKWSLVRVAVGDLILNNSCELCKLEWIEIKNHSGENCLNKNVCQHCSTAVNSKCKIKNTFSGSCYKKR